MIEKEQNIDKVLAENSDLKSQLEEAHGLLEAIREGNIDALVVNVEGKPTVYSLETADFTYRVLIEKFGEGALSISEKGIILYCNEYFAKMINTPANKIVGTFFNSYVDSVGQFKALEDNLTSGHSKGEIVLNINGTKIPVYVSLTSLQPTLPAIGIIVTDLTEKRRHEEDIALYQRKLELKITELNQTNERLSQFIHVISHDIKEPVRKIITYGNHLLASQAALKDKTCSDHLNIISNSAVRLNSLVDDLVKYSVTSSVGNVVDVDLNTILYEVAEDLEFVIMENNASITVKELPHISGSKTQMRQLFANLITNALKFKSPARKPDIRISSEITDCVDMYFPNKKFHKITVSDNGIGIEKEYLKKIFVIFQRLHLPEEYTGIGLAICKRIMENHFRKIAAESVHGEGSTMILYFPVKTDLIK